MLNYSILLMMFLMTLSMLLYIISMKSFFDREKSSPFECGFSPISSPRTPFSSHFFLIAVIFLVFDVELVVIMPMIICMPYNNMLDMYIVMYKISECGVYCVLPRLHYLSPVDTIICRAPNSWTLILRINICCYICCSYFTLLQMTTLFFD